MSDEIIKINFEITWDKLEDIFKKPKVMASFNEGYKESEKLMRSVIANFYSNDVENPSQQEIDNLLSEFKRFLKGQIFTTALSHLIIKQELDVENVLIKLNKPENQLIMANTVINSAFGFLLKNDSNEESNRPSSSLLS